MRVLIVKAGVPFVPTRPDYSERLFREVEKAGHDVEIVNIPVWGGDRLPEDIDLIQSIDFSQTDRLIALDFPSAMARHPLKSVWLINRPLPLPVGKYKLADSVHVYACDTDTHEWLRGNASSGLMLRPPLDNPGLYASGPDQGYLLAIGSFDRRGWSEVVCDAFACAGGHTPLVIALGGGTAEPPEPLMARVANLHPTASIRVIQMPRDVAARAQLFSRSRAVVFLPAPNENDVTPIFEAFCSSRAVLTLSDCGVAADMIAKTACYAVELRGFSAAYRLLGGDPKVASRLGRAARASWDRSPETWSRAVEKLLA